ncbi:MAG: GTP cyclohydrolase II [Alphaproteobacteria bacterium]|nr:GTP cyclohydrolase II [Alphaproteobacteria bacterium]
MIDLAPEVTSTWIAELAAGEPVRPTQRAVPGDEAAAAAIALAKLALLLPAPVVARVAPGVALDGLITLPAERIAEFEAMRARSLEIVSRARVPLRAAHDSQLVVFRDVLGRLSTAVLIGQPDLAGVVPVRLHSACLTGDVFGSLRCDCGDQLRIATEMMHERGGGVVLYLDQEGRGIGLANKMRAYVLQDRGLDTFDANTTLGFEHDERHYDVAARMLELLGVTRIMLLTNNPSKIDAVAAAGVTVVDRLPVIAPVNHENRRYLEAKATRVGHLLDEIDPEPLRHAARRR